MNVRTTYTTGDLILHVGASVEYSEYCIGRAFGVSYELSKGLVLEKEPRRLIVDQDKSHHMCREINPRETGKNLLQSTFLIRARMVNVRLRLD